MLSRSPIATHADPFRRALSVTGNCAMTRIPQLKTPQGRKEKTNGHHSPDYPVLPGNHADPRLIEVARNLQLVNEGADSGPFEILWWVD